MTALVDSAWLFDHLEDPSVVVIEVSSAVTSEAEYFGGHIPGSHFAHWKTLCWHETDRQFPDPDEMARRLGAFGVDDDSTIVLVGDPIQYATYAYWVLAMTGISENAVILDGGRATWLAENRPVTTEISEPTPVALQRTPTPVDCRLGREQVRAGLGDPHRLILDVRSPEEFSGERVSPPHMDVDHGAQRTGRIPGAEHLYYMELLADDGTFKPVEDLAALFGDAGAETDRDVVTYCRLSHRATLGWFVMTELLGYTNARVYDGSWTEWGSIVGFPIER